MGRKLSGKAGKSQKRLHKTESVGQTAWTPYAPTGAMRLDDDESLQLKYIKRLTIESIKSDISYAGGPMNKD